MAAPEKNAALFYSDSRASLTTLAKIAFSAVKSPIAPLG
jgi:hypothetical protein